MNSLIPKEKALSNKKRIFKLLNYGWLPSKLSCCCPHFFGNAPLEKTLGYWYEEINLVVFGKWLAMPE
jgi:hypothetical protein